MTLLGFFSLLVSPRDPGSNNYFPLLKLVLFYRWWASMENFRRPLRTLLTINAVTKPANKQYRKFESEKSFSEAAKLVNWLFWNNPLTCLYTILFIKY